MIAKGTKAEMEALLAKVNKALGGYPRPGVVSDDPGVHRPVVIQSASVVLPHATEPNVWVLPLPDSLMARVDKGLLQGTEATDLDAAVAARVPEKVDVIASIQAKKAQEVPLATKVALGVVAAAAVAAAAYEIAQQMGILQ